MTKDIKVDNNIFNGTFISDSKKHTSPDTLGSGPVPTTSQEGRGESSLSRSIQAGQGLHSSHFVDQIAEAVIRKIDSEKIKTNPRWWNYERSEPTVVTVDASDTTPPPHFSTPIVETDMNDSFDEQALLKKIPKPFKQNASRLLKEFDQRPNELTWDSNGHIYIDEKAIPNASIFVLFPRLFSRRATKKIDGMPDFLQKLDSMGLNHLIRADSKTSAMSETKEKNANSLTKSENWWYLGE